MLKAAVLGHPVAHSLSPRLHGFWLRRYGINGSYAALDITPQDLPNTLRTLSAQGLRGVNLTVPHKETACAVVDTLDPAAQRIGAVNLVTVEQNSTLVGRNTDAYGFAQNLLTAGYSPNGTAVVVGAGGAARAVLVALGAMGMTKIFLANRTKTRAEKLAQALTTPQCPITALDWHEAPAALGTASLLVNTTSLGMTGQPALDLSLDDLQPTATVTDIVYTPLETDLLRRARLRGNKTVDGLGMLLHQARPSFAAFFGYDPTVDEDLRRFMQEAAP